MTKPARSTARRGAAVLALLACLGPAAARGAERFPFGPRTGTIDLTASNLGLFHTHGTFDRFIGQLTIDLAHPSAMRIALVVDATSIHARWQRQTNLLRSAAFLDVADYPVIRFASRAITADGPGRYLVRGQIEIRGVTRPIVLTARLLPAAHAPAGRGQIEEFVVTGRLNRRAFGMTSGSLLVSDQVELAIHARIILGSAHGG